MDLSNHYLIQYQIHGVWETGDGTPMLDDTFLNKVGGGTSKLEKFKRLQIPKFVDVSLTQLNLLNKEVIQV